MTTRVVVMSDIHGNFPALQAVAAALPSADAVFVAGDLCLEGPCPAAVVDFLQEHGWPCVRGNTDLDIISPPDNGNKRARALWTRDQLGEERLQWLDELPFSRTFEGDGEGVLIVHANPKTVDEHLQPTMREEQLAPYLEGVDEHIIAFGHLHIPYVRPVAGKLLVDVSSVGHPKDGDRRAAFTVMSWDTGGSRRIEQVRVPYDIDETVRLIRASGMPGAEDEIASLLKASS